MTGIEDSGWSPEMLLEVYNRAARWQPFAGQLISACMMGTVSGRSNGPHRLRLDRSDSLIQELLYGVETALAFGQGESPRSRCILFRLIAEFTACLMTFLPVQYDRVIGANNTGMTLEDLTSVVIAYADSVRHAELELAEEGEGKL